MCVQIWVSVETKSSSRRGPHVKVEECRHPGQQEGETSLECKNPWPIVSTSPYMVMLAEADSHPSTMGVRDRNIPAFPAPIISSPSTSTSVHLWTQPSSLQDLIWYCINCPYKSIYLVVDFVSFFFNTWITRTLLWLYIQRHGLNIASSGYRVRKICMDGTLHYKWWRAIVG